jgi:NAD+ synthase (glutamine-hydrolysing)
LAAYAYASAGPTESTTDVVFGGHCLIAENGQILANDRIIGDVSEPRTPNESVTTDIDLGRLEHDRRKSNSWSDCRRRSEKTFRYIETEFPSSASQAQPASLKRTISGTPFVPRITAELDDRCAEVFGIQCAALEKRVSRLPENLPLNIGVSGGLDSTLALLVAVKACQQAGWPTSRVAAVTMPGFGTTPKTLSSARSLMRLLGVASSEIDIRQLCLDTFHALSHEPFGLKAASSLQEFEEQLRDLEQDELSDLTFENVQARQRTMILMSRGFVLGTGDLSEQALGWSTYNGDHMSMYNVNASVPKTLVKFLVRYVAEREFDGETRKVLLDVVDTPISPELLPASGKEIQQFTEQSLGPYELHDFFLYYMVRFGFGPTKIAGLAQHAEFSRHYDLAEIVTTLRTFLKRFFANQFKRSCVPDGPKVGSVSLSPRGDWRMPSDADADAWLNELDSIQDSASND